MFSLLLNITVNAIAVMLTPATIIVMLLFSVQGTMRVQGTTMLFSRWILNILVMIGIIALGQYAASRSNNTHHSSLTFSLVLAALFFILAIAAWRQRPKDAEEPKAPKWLDKLTNMNPLLIIGVNILTMIISVKNFALMASAASQIAQYTTSSSERLVLIVYYSFACMFLMAVIWAITLFGGKNAQSDIARLRAWIYKYGAIIMAVLLFAFALFELYNAYKLYHS